MPRTIKKQINIKMPESLIDALKNQAESEGNTFTDLVIRLCEQGLGIESSNSQTRAFPFEPEQLDERIADQLAPLQDRLFALESELGGVKRLREEAESLKQQSQQPDLAVVRDRILSGLKVGKQSPEFKRTKAAIDRFISEVGQ